MMVNILVRISSLGRDVMFVSLWWLLVLWLSSFKMWFYLSYYKKLVCYRDRLVGEREKV